MQCSYKVSKKEINIGHEADGSQKIFLAPYIKTNRQINERTQLHRPVKVHLGIYLPLPKRLYHNLQDTVK